MVAALAVGQTIVILTAGIDLSVGAIAILSAMVMAKVPRTTASPALPRWRSGSSSPPSPGRSTACS